MSHLDEVERRMDQAVMQRFRHRKGAGAGAVGVAAPSGGGFQRTPDAEPMNEGDFQTAMIRRLKLLEQDARSKSALLEQARVENAELQKKIRVLEERLAPQSGQSSSADDVGDNSLAAEALEVIDHLRSENSRLRREADGAWEQCKAMKRFLNDYGMVWVGEFDSRKNVDVEPGKAQGDSRVVIERKKDEQPAKPCPIDVAKLERAVDQLNRTQEGKRAAPVPLAVYRDGVQLHVLPFMPFTDPAARGVVQDIIDGFYPYQLREDFPEGAHLVLLDKAGMTYVPTSARGEGAGAGGAAGAPQQAGNVHGMASLGQPKDGPRTKEEYLKKLPETVIKNGKIVELRKGISDFISGRDGGGNAGRPPRDAASQKDARSGPHAAGGPLATSAIDRLLKRGPSSKAVTSQLLVGQHKSAGPSRSPSVRGSLNEKAASAVEVCAESDHSDEPCATLQIKAEDGRMHVLKMAATATIGQLRSKLDILRVPQGPYEIRSAFPPRAYSDLAETLEAAGLVPNATLFARATRS